jgi:hypothetical protein
MATPKLKDPALLAQTNLVRLIEANLKVVTQDDAELAFRRQLIRQVAAQSETMNPGLLTRVYEAVCAVEFPKGDVVKLRVKLQTVIAGNLSFTTPAAANSNK